MNKMPDHVRTLLRQRARNKVRLRDLTEPDVLVATDCLVDTIQGRIPGSTPLTDGIRFEVAYLKYLPAVVGATLQQRLCHRPSRIWVFDGTRRVRRDVVCYERQALVVVLEFLLPDRKPQQLERYLGNPYYLPRGGGTARPLWEGDPVTPAAAVG